MKDNNMNKQQLIFIAVPSSGVVRDGALTSEFISDLAELHTRYPQHTFISPMLQDYALLPYMKLNATWEDWGHHCRTIIERSDEVWVLMYDGWETSVGVRGECEHANKHNIPVQHIVVNG
jgi:hypothetical protein